MTESWKLMPCQDMETRRSHVKNTWTMHNPMINTSINSSLETYICFLNYFASNNTLKRFWQEINYSQSSSSSIPINLCPQSTIFCRYSMFQQLTKAQHKWKHDQAKKKEEVMRRSRTQLEYIHKTNSPAKPTREQFLRDTMNTFKPAYPMKVTRKTRKMASRKSATKYK